METNIIIQGEGSSGEGQKEVSGKRMLERSPIEISCIGGGSERKERRSLSAVVDLT